MDATDPSDSLVARHLRAAAEALPPADPEDKPGLRFRMDLARCLLAVNEPGAAQVLADAAAAGAEADLDALNLRIDTALGAGDFAAALRIVEEGRALFPEEVLYLRKKLAILRRAGRFEETPQVLEALHRERPGNPAFLIELGQAQLALGRPEAAGQAFDAVLEIAPQSAAAWLGRLDVAEAGPDPEAVDRAAEAAFAALPDNPTITIRAARRLMRAGRMEEARDRLEAGMKSHRDPPAGMAVALAQALAELGDHAGVDAVYDDLRRRNPGQANVWAGHVRILLNRGDVDHALALSAAALDHCPGAQALLRLRADALRWAGRRDEALGLLETLRAQRPADTETALALAGAYRQAGRMGDANGLFKEVLARDPDNWPALQGRVDIAEARSDMGTALRLLLGRAEVAPHPSPDPSPDPAPDSGASLEEASLEEASLEEASLEEDGLEIAATVPMRLLRLAEIGFRAGETARARAAMERLGPKLSELNNAQLVRFMNLADRQRQLSLLALAIRSGMERPVIDAALAVAVLRRAHAAEDEALANEIEDILAARVQPQQRPVFHVQAARLRRGPEAAYQVLRRQPVARRTPREAMVLAGALVASGRSRLAIRYLRLCRRLWPDAAGLRGTLLNAYLQAGRPQEALDWLADIPPDAETDDLDRMRANIAVATGDLEQAREIMTRQVVAGQRKPGDETLLQTQIGLGRVDEALQTAEAVRADLEQSPKYAAHFRSGLNGQILNDLMLYRQQRPATAEGDPPPEPTPGEAAIYFFAAKEAIDRWLATGRDRPPAAQAPPAVPRRIFQYWNSAAVPAAVAELMQSWRARPGWEYRLLSRRAAIDWLRGACGPRYAKAFTFARSAAEESDFLRLCLLAKEGGIYADADDKLVGRPEELLAQGPGLILFREPFGAVPNNLICAPAGHPVITGAANMVCAALLRRDNDTTWLKTGPGLLTRALALHVLRDPAAAAADTTLVPLYRMHRSVHPHTVLPYKSTRKYWDPRAGGLDPEIDAALRDLVRRGGAAA